MSFATSVHERKVTQNNKFGKPVGTVARELNVKVNNQFLRRSYVL